MQLGFGSLEWELWETAIISLWSSRPRGFDVHHRLHINPDADYGHGFCNISRVSGLVWGLVSHISVHVT
jgi:hypothetical protein